MSTGQAAQAQDRKRRVFRRKITEEVIWVINPETEVEEPYAMKELTAEQRDEYLSSLSSKVEISGNEAKSIRDFRGISTRLVAMSLVKLEANPDGEPTPGGKRTAVTESDLKQWPAPTIEEIAEECRRISALNKKGQQEAKNA